MSIKCKSNINVMGIVFQSCVPLNLVKNKNNIIIKECSDAKFIVYILNYN